MGIFNQFQDEKKYGPEKKLATKKNPRQALDSMARLYKQWADESQDLMFDFDERFPTSSVLIEAFETNAIALPNYSRVVQPLFDSAFVHIHAENIPLTPVLIDHFSADMPLHHQTPRRGGLFLSAMMVHAYTAGHGHFSLSLKEPIGYVGAYLHMFPGHLSLDVYGETGMGAATGSRNITVKFHDTVGYDAARDVTNCAIHFKKGITGRCGYRARSTTFYAPNQKTLDSIAENVLDKELQLQGEQSHFVVT